MLYPTGNLSYSHHSHLLALTHMSKDSFSFVCYILQIQLRYLLLVGSKLVDFTSRSPYVAVKKMFCKFPVFCNLLNQPNLSRLHLQNQASCRIKHRSSYFCRRRVRVKARRSWTNALLFGLLLNSLTLSLSAVCNCDQVVCGGCLTGCRPYNSCGNGGTSNWCWCNILNTDCGDPYAACGLIGILFP